MKKHNSNWTRMIQGGISALTITTLLTATAAFAQQVQRPPETMPEHQQQHKVTHKGSSFIKEAAEGNLAEVELGQMAQQKTQNPQVKQFAERMVQDHTQANQQLQTLAQTGGVKFPTEPSHKHRKEMKRLEKMTGTEFDQHYARYMLEDHSKDIKNYSKAAENLEDPGVKQYTPNHPAQLQQHLQHARQMAQKRGVVTNTNPSAGASQRRRWARQGPAQAPRRATRTSPGTAWTKRTNSDQGIWVLATVRTKGSWPAAMPAIVFLPDIQAFQLMLVPDRGASHLESATGAQTFPILRLQDRSFG